MRLSPLLLLPLVTACVPEETTAPVGMANPASTYCVQQGGRSEIRKQPAGEAGYCHLPDGRVVEEWAFFRAAKR